MFVGAIEFDLLLGDVGSLKHKRAVLRPILARLRRLQLSVAEVGEQDLHRRARIGVAAVAGDQRQVQDLLDSCERLVAAEPEVQLLSAGRRMFSTAD